MNINISSDKIDKFEDEMLKNDAVINKFLSYDGKNYWNIIRSSMDWISVATEGIPTITFNPSGFGYNHGETLKLMNCVVAIDVLIESIKQLFRVFGDYLEYPLKDDKSIFNQEKISDDVYFKHLRAAFSTHPVNLNSIDGMQASGEERFYASWVAKNSLTHDYYVILYSNLPEREDNLSLGVNIKDLELYVYKRYDLLDELINVVKLIQLENSIDQP